MHCPVQQVPRSSLLRYLQDLPRPRLRLAGYGARIAPVLGTMYYGTTSTYRTAGPFESFTQRAGRANSQSQACNGRCPGRCGPSFPSPDRLAHCSKPVSILDKDGHAESWDQQRTTRLVRGIESRLESAHCRRPYWVRRPLFGLLTYFFQTLLIGAPLLHRRFFSTPTPHLRLPHDKDYRSILCPSQHLCTPASLKERASRSTASTLSCQAIRADARRSSSLTQSKTRESYLERGRGQWTKRLSCTRHNSRAGHSNTFGRSHRRVRSWSRHSSPGSPRERHPYPRLASAASSAHESSLEHLSHTTQRVICLRRGVRTAPILGRSRYLRGARYPRALPTATAISRHRPTIRHHHSTLGDPGSSSVPSTGSTSLFPLDPVRREAKRTVPPSKRCQQGGADCHQSIVLLSAIPSYLLLDTPFPGTGICANHRHARTHSLACLAAHSMVHQQLRRRCIPSTTACPPTITRHVVSQTRWSPSST